MPLVIVTESARFDLIRVREFIRSKNPRAATQAGKTLADAFRRLATHPRMGRPIESVVGLHKLIVPFGAAGYVVHYRYLSEVDGLYVLRVRHSLEDAQD